MDVQWVTEAHLAIKKEKFKAEQPISSKDVK